MSRTEKAILALALLIITLIVVLDMRTPKEQDWSLRPSRYNQAPFGAALVYERLTDLFPQGVTTVRRSMAEVRRERDEHRIATAPVNHILIDERAALDSLAINDLLAMVEDGDHALIVANWFSYAYNQRLGFEEQTHWEPMNWDVGDPARSDTSWLGFTAMPLLEDSAYAFSLGAVNSSFSKLPDQGLRTLAANQRGEPVLVSMELGKGRLYLCTTPKAFTNFYLLHDEARGFMERVFTLLPDRPVLWDEFSKMGRDEERTPLRYILSQPPLKTAFWLMVALLVLTILVYARRRQRAIPAMAPPRNTSRDFADTLGRLYYYRGDHADLGRKICAQFREEVKTKLRLQRAEWNEENMQEIAAITGVEYEKLQHVKGLMDYYKDIDQVSEFELMRLNRTLDELRARLWP